MHWHQRRKVGFQEHFVGRGEEGFGCDDGRRLEMIHTDCGLGYLRLSNEENEVHGLFTVNICVLEEMKCDLGT